jgi:hypothetical protein
VKYKKYKEKDPGMEMSGSFFVRNFLHNGKHPAGGPGVFGEGISLLWGVAKNYIMYWGVYDT